jgi:hypothetical protein
MGTHGHGICGLGYALPPVGTPTSQCTADLIVYCTRGGQVLRVRRNQNFGHVFRVCRGSSGANEYCKSRCKELLAKFQDLFPETLPAGLRVYGRTQHVIFFDPAVHVKIGYTPRQSPKEQAAIEPSILQLLQ